MRQRSISYCLILILQLCLKCLGVVREFSVEEQRVGLTREFSRCLALQESTTSGPLNNSEIICPADFDGLSCWTATPANQTAYRQCPDYLNLFDSEETASRHCTAAGTWLETAPNKSVGEYYHCYKNAHLVQNRKLEMYDLSPKKFVESDSTMVKHLQYIEKLYTIGNAISVATLIAAISVFLILRKLLSSSRNVIHINLFISFVLRGVCTMIHYFLTVRQDSSVEHVYEYNQELDDVYVTADGNAGCKLNTTLWMYTRLSNFTWIFMEAFYLHLLLFVITFNDKQNMSRFIAVGWSAPMAVLIPWIVARLTVDDNRCWATYSFKKQNLRWIVEAPVILIVIVNFVFFLNFIRLLSSKLKASQANGFKEQANRRLAKSSFIMIPLFGIHYIIFLFTDLYPNVAENTTLELFGLYFDTIFTSFQGVAVAILFCFCNKEVISELQKKWLKIKTESRRFWKQTRHQSTRPRQRISVSSDTGVTYTVYRQSSNGLLSVSLSSERRPSLRRDVSIPTPIDEEQSKLLTTKETGRGSSELENSYNVSKV